SRRASPALRNRFYGVGWVDITLDFIHSSRNSRGNSSFLPIALKAWSSAGKSMYNAARGRRRHLAESLRQDAERIVETLRAAGHEAYFAGGCVRDMVMGVEPHDYDIATSARPEEVVRLFPGSLTVGVQFGV